MVRAPWLQTQLVITQPQSNKARTFVPIADFIWSCDKRGSLTYITTLLYAVLMSYALCIIFCNTTLFTNFFALHLVFQTTHSFPLWCQHTRYILCNNNTKLTDCTQFRIVHTCAHTYTRWYWNRCHHIYPHFHMCLIFKISNIKLFYVF